MNTHEIEFKKWAKTRQVLNELPNLDIKKGDIVSYTNPYGVKFTGLKVLGFCEPDGNRCVYLNIDCYWFPVDPNKISYDK